MKFHCRAVRETRRPSIDRNTKRFISLRTLVQTEGWSRLYIQLRMFYRISLGKQTLIKILQSNSPHLCFHIDPKERTNETKGDGGNALHWIGGKV